MVDPRYKYQFDLNPLRKLDKDYHVTFGGYDYVINVCGGLVEDVGCDKSSGVGSCQTKPSDSAFTSVPAGRLVIIYFFSIQLLSVLLGHLFFSSPPQRPMNSHFEGFLSQIFSITFIFLP